MDSQITQNSRIAYPREGGQPLNHNALKYRTPGQRRALCAAYLDHASQGLSDRSFVLCDPKTLKAYCEKYPVDFPPDIVWRAKARRMLFWEQIGILGTMGKIKGFRAQSWCFIMGNYFGWSHHVRDTNEDHVSAGIVIYKPEKYEIGRI